MDALLALECFGGDAGFELRGELSSLSFHRSDFGVIRPSKNRQSFNRPLAPFPGITSVTTPEIARSLASRIHFNTFGGNPVSCAQGRAVLSVIEEEGLQLNTLTIGNYLMEGMGKLSEKHSIIGQVRGKGLMLGVELVKDRLSKEPAKEECAEVFERCKDLGLLIGKGGSWGNTLRVKPPMCITRGTQTS